MGTIENDEISLKEIIVRFNEWLTYLISKWKVILVAGLLGASLGLAYAFSQKYTYTAEYSFALEDAQSGGSMGAYAGLASQFGFDLGGGGGNAFSGDNLMELMKSRSMVEKSLLRPININGKSQTIIEYYIDFNKLRSNWEDNPNLTNIHFPVNGSRANYTLQQDSILGEVYKTLINGPLTVGKKDKKLSIISVKVKSKNELFAKYFTESLVKEVSDFYIETKTKKSAENLAILQHQTDSVKRALNSALYGVAASNDNTPNLNVAKQVLRVPSQRKQVDVQANSVILQELVKNLEISKVSLRKETPLIQVIDKPILPLEKEKMGKKKGVIVGGIIAGFLTVLYLILRRLLSKILA